MNRSATSLLLAALVIACLPEDGADKGVANYAFAV
jgi:hypothetical protein